MQREERVPITIKGLIQHVADNFDADMWSPNGKVSTHSLAMIECYPGSENTIETETFPRISKAEMQIPVHVNELEDELIFSRGEVNPLPPPLPSSDLPDKFFMKQRISYDRAKNMDFEFFMVSYPFYTNYQETRRPP